MSEVKIQVTYGTATIFQREGDDYNKVEVAPRREGEDPMCYFLTDTELFDLATAAEQFKVLLEIQNREE